MSHSKITNTKVVCKEPNDIVVITQDDERSVILQTKYIQVQNQTSIFAELWLLLSYPALPQGTAEGAVTSFLIFFSSADI